MPLLPLDESTSLSAARPLTRRTVLGTGVTVVAVAAAGSVVARATRASAGPTGTTVTASSFGFDPADATDALQAALDSTADTVIIDNVGQTWITRPLFLRRSNLTVIVEDGVTVLAKTGAFDGGNDCLLTIDAQHDIVLSGYGARFQMDRAEYEPLLGEWRMSIKLRSVRNVAVEGLTLYESGGDGVYVGVQGSSGLTYCENVTLRDLVIDRQFRNGISVISAKGLTIEGCLIADTDGTPPRAGIDFEPNDSRERLEDIVIRDCVFSGNGSYQVLFFPGNFTAASTPLSVTIERTLLEGQVYGSPMLMLFGMGADDPGGFIDVNDVVIRNTEPSGSIGIFNNHANGLDLRFRRTVIWHWGNDFLVYPPIMIAAGLPDGRHKVDAYGGVHFEDCLAITDQPGPVLVARSHRDDEPVPDPEPRLSDVHGTLAAVSPTTPTLDLGHSPDNVDLRFLPVTADSAADPFGVKVEVASRQTRVAAGDSVVLDIRRKGGLVEAPLAVEYQFSGDAEERSDITGQGHVAVIPAGTTGTSVAVGTRRGSHRGQVLETSVVASPFYRDTQDRPALTAITPVPR